MPLLEALAGPAIGAVGDIFGSKAAAKAAKEASKIQAGSIDKALNFEKTQYADEQTRLQPYRDLGGQAFSKIGKMFGLESSQPAYGGGPMPSTGGGSFTFARPQMGGGMVKIRHPRTGEIREVPAAQADILIRERGGVRVA